MTNTLSHEILGSGSGLVLLHGTSSTGTGSWGTVLDGLAARHTVVLPDLPGSGDSPLPGAPLDLDEVADQVVATADEAGLRDFAVAGASLGAAIAIRVATRHPGRVCKLAALVGYAFPRTTLRLNLELWAALHASGDENLGKLLTSLSFSESFLAALPSAAVEGIVHEFGAHPAPGAAAQIRFTLGIDVRQDLGAVRAPTLVVAATEDRFVAPQHSRELAREIPGARLAEVPGGHAAIIEDPAQTEKVLLHFLAE